MAESYEFDVFLSYRRRGPALDWVQNHFFPKLRGWLEQYWPDKNAGPRIAKDDEMEAGSRWPARLVKMHGGSKVMVAVLSQEYFRSPWCSAEWAAMRQRERALGLGGSKNSRGLIYPVLFCGDASELPKDAQTRQCVDFSALNTPDPIFKQHALYVEFDRAMQKVARDVVAMVKRAPERKRWPPLKPPPAPRRNAASLPRLVPLVAKGRRS